MVRYSQKGRESLEIKEEWATDRERWKVSERPATPSRETAAKGEKVVIKNVIYHAYT